MALPWNYQGAYQEKSRRKSRKNARRGAKARPTLRWHGRGRKVHSLITALLALFPPNAYKRQEVNAYIEIENDHYLSKLWHALRRPAEQHQAHGLDDALRALWLHMAAIGDSFHRSSRTTRGHSRGCTRGTRRRCTAAAAAAAARAETGTGAGARAGAGAGARART